MWKHSLLWLGQGNAVLRAPSFRSWLPHAVMLEEGEDQLGTWLCIMSWQMFPLPAEGKTGKMCCVIWASLCRLQLGTVEVLPAASVLQTNTRDCQRGNLLAVCPQSGNTSESQVAKIPLSTWTLPALSRTDAVWGVLWSTLSLPGLYVENGHDLMKKCKWMLGGKGWGAPERECACLCMTCHHLANFL